MNLPPRQAEVLVAKLCYDLPMDTEPPDGSLEPWDDIADEHEWAVLVLGNGLSRNVWPPFGYGSLLDHAAQGSLTVEDRALFQDTTNFERVLGDLNTAIRTNRIIGMDTDAVYERYRSIQRGLGEAVREVHLTRSQVPDHSLAAIRDVMERFEWVFTTSYDLLIYWAMGYGGPYAPFRDFFQYAGRCEFDATRSEVQAGEVPVYYLHGALHLVVGARGATWKLRQKTLQTILDQFGQAVDGDPESRPLFVTEGSPQDKRRTIEANAYLTHSLDRLAEVDLPVVVFGSALGEQDDHIVAALSENASRPVAVSMMPGWKRDLARQQVDLWGRLETERLYFFDATTHPLGAAGLRAPLP